MVNSESSYLPLNTYQFITPFSLHCLHYTLLLFLLLHWVVVLVFFDSPSFPRRPLLTMEHPKTVGPLLLIYIHFLGNVISFPGFEQHPNGNDSQIYVFSPEFTPELQTCRSIYSTNLIYQNLNFWDALFHTTLLPELFSISDDDTLQLHRPKTNLNDIRLTPLFFTFISIQQEISASCLYFQNIPRTQSRFIVTVSVTRLIWAT